MAEQGRRVGCISNPNSSNSPAADSQMATNCSTVQLKCGCELQSLCACSPGGSRTDREGFCTHSVFSCRAGSDQVLSVQRWLLQCSGLEWGKRHRSSPLLQRMLQKGEETQRFSSPWKNGAERCLRLSVFLGRIVHSHQTVVYRTDHFLIISATEGAKLHLFTWLFPVPFRRSANCPVTTSSKGATSLSYWKQREGELWFQSKLC